VIGVAPQDFFESQLDACEAGQDGGGHRPDGSRRRDHHGREHRQIKNNKTTATDNGDPGTGSGRQVRCTAFIKSSGSGT
jgi:hypothetical protein